MLKPKWIVLISALLILACQPATYAKRAKHAVHGASISKDPNYKFFKSAYAYSDYGFSTMDVNKFFYSVAPDVVYRDTKDHVYTIDQMKQALYNIFRRLYGDNASLSRTTQILRVTYANDNAFVVVRSSVSGSLPTSPDSNPFVASGSATHEDEWKRVSPGWLMVRTRLISTSGVTTSDN